MINEMENQYEFKKMKKANMQQSSHASPKTMGINKEKVNAFGINEGLLKQRAKQRVFAEDKINTEYVSQEELKDYVGKNVPLPSFTPLTTEEEKSLKKRKAAKYRVYKKQKERYIKQLNFWGENEVKRKHAYRQVLRVRRQGDAYPQIKPDVDSMTEAFFWEDEHKERIKNLGIAETKALMELTKYSQLEKAKDGLKNYVGDYYTYMNEYLRNGQKFELLSKKSQEKLQEKDGLEKFRHAINAFSMQQMSHQLVTRRYVGINTLRFMFGTKDEQEAQDFMRQWVKEKEKKVYMEEKGFTSTAMYVNQGNEEFKNKVEIIMLVEKGTKAISIAGTDIEKYDEAELLLAPGTKYELIDIRENTKDKKKPVWRIYMRTIPQEKEGTLA